MVIRNRIASLIYRIMALAALLLLIVFYFLSSIEPYVAVSYFGVLVSFMLAALFFLEIIFNAIDLRRGKNGLPAGVNMHLALPIVCFCMEASFGHFIFACFSGFGTLIEILFYVGLFLLPLADWLMFDEKGTVPFYTAFTSQIIPIFYGIFSVFRAIIWPQATLINGAMYPYPFLNPHSPWFWPGCIITFFCLLTFTLLIVFLNNLLSFKYRKARIR